jgi:catechol 2,3-dioxygenase-like lactoylglutathione lyase family enzyme
MAVLGPYGFVLEVPDLEAGIRFYTDAGLNARRDGNVVRFRCDGQDRDCITLLGGAPRKRIHHLILRADPQQLGAVRRAVPDLGGQLIEAPSGFPGSGLWVQDPHGLRIHLYDAPAEKPQVAGEAFEINGPGRLIRKDRRAIPAKATIGPIRPLRLGHILLFTPDVLRSVDFFSRALGMGLADRSQDVVAFMCARRDSDHHVVAFAKSDAIGFHHGSFQVRTPDEVGLGGRRLVQQGNPVSWGFGRHTIGSNFFHYIQDPWGSWFEYYSDIDHIADYSRWEPLNYPIEDALENWGPELPGDFARNFESTPAAFARP